VAAWSAPVAATPPSFVDAGPVETDTGYAAISWTSVEPVTLELASAANPADARQVYTGSNTDYFVSGLADGTYRLVLRDAAGEVSAPLKLVVAHQSISRAFLLAALGALAFLAIVAVILKGARDD